MTEYNTEYALELWDYTRSYLTFDEALQVIRGNSKRAMGDGIEALENFHFPEVGEVPRVTKAHLEEMPDKLAEKVWQHEYEGMKPALHVADAPKQDVYGVINWMEIGEELFDKDLEDDIVAAINLLPECETKVDMLEEYEEISGEEWYQRTEKLTA